MADFSKSNLEKKLKQAPPPPGADSLKEANSSQESEAFSDSDSYEADEKNLQLKILEARLERRNDENKRLQDKHMWRQEYAAKLYNLACCWIGILFCFTFADAMFSFSAMTTQSIPSKYSLSDVWLSDTVLVTLWGTSTATVIGLFVYVAKYLFPSAEEKKSEKKK